MQIYVGAVLLIIVMILSVLLICGLPLGELTFFGNTVMNFFSTSKKEKCIMTPMSLVEAICFTITALYL